jgi:guanosine-3',5'-bis(diphosphate) 3'-pyrophosphohydrolase
LEFFIAIHKLDLNPDTIANEISERIKHPVPSDSKEPRKENVFEKFIETARGITSGIKFFGTQDNYLHSFAKCCSPIPGDEIVGFVTTGEGIKIHRKNCTNLLNVSDADPNRIVSVDWPRAESVEFAAAIKMSGEDRHGLLSDLTNVVSSFQNTNIRGVDIVTHDKIFEGTLIVSVKNLDNLTRLMEKLRKIKGVNQAVRLEH